MEGALQYGARLAETLTSHDWCRFGFGKLAEKFNAHFDWLKHAAVIYKPIISQS